MRLDEASEAIVATLEGAGVRATNDPRNANPPCVLVRPPTITFRYGKGTYDAEWEAWCMVPSAGMSADLRALGDLVVDATSALAYAPVSARPDDVVTADGGTVPVYILTWSARITA